VCSTDHRCHSVNSMSITDLGHIKGRLGVKIFFRPRFKRDRVLKSDVEVSKMSSTPSDFSVSLEEDVLPNTTVWNRFLFAFSFARNLPVY